MENNSLNKAMPNLNFANLAKIANVEVKLTAVLGECSVPLETVLGLDKGSIVQLDKLEGESIDIYVDNVLVAKGEIVAVDNVFGVKITEIVDNSIVG